MIKFNQKIERMVFQMETNRLQLGERIRAKRKALNMTQQELAEKLNITNKAVSKWETDEAYPDISLLPKLSEILGVTIDELLTGNETTNPTNTENDIDCKTQFISVNPTQNRKRIILCYIGLIVSSILALVHLLSGILAFDTNAVIEVFGNTSEQNFLIIYSGIWMLLFLIIDCILIRKVKSYNYINQKIIISNTEEAGFIHISKLSKIERRALYKEFMKNNTAVSLMYIIFVAVFIAACVLAIIGQNEMGRICYYVSIIGVSVVNLYYTIKYNGFLLNKNILTGNYVRK